MVYQRKPSSSFCPRRVLEKKPPGQLMQKIRKLVQQSQAYMPLNAPYRNTGSNRGQDVENIGFADNGKTYDSSKSVHVNQGRDNGVGTKPRKYPSGDNLAMTTGDFVPLGKRKLLALSSSLMDLHFGSSDRNRLSNRVVESKKGAVSSAKASLFPNKRKVVESTQGNIVGCGVHIADERKKEQSFTGKVHKNPGSKSKRILGMKDLRRNSDKVKVSESIKVNVVGRRVVVDENHKERELETPTSRSNPSLGTKDLRGNSDIHKRIETLSLGNKMKRIEGPPVKDFSTKNDKFISKGKALLEKNSVEHASGIEDTATDKKVKRKRRYICNDDDDDMSGDDPNVISGDGQNIAGVDYDIDGLTTQTTIVEQYGSLPIDEPIWSGVLKTGSEGYVSLEAHLLAKSCEKVWECSTSLRPMVQVTKLSRFEAEPKCFRASSPTEDNIGLYFFPQGMRPNEDYDKLVKEVMDNDFILRAIVDEADMLIFPSIVLPERHQTFQGKHYLWGLFKRREDEVHVEGGKRMRGTGHAKGNGKQRCSGSRVVQKGNDKDRRTSASLARSNASTRPAELAAAGIATPALAATAALSYAPSSRRPDERAAAEAATPAPAITSHAPGSTRPAERTAAGIATPALAATAAMSHAPSSTRPGERAAAEAAASPAPAVTSHVPSSTRPAEGAAAEAATPATAAASHSPSSAVPHAGMYFIGQPTSEAQLARMQQHLEALVREGALVFAMRGETIGLGLGGASSAAA